MAIPDCLHSYYINTCTLNASYLDLIQSPDTFFGCFKSVKQGTLEIPIFIFNKAIKELRRSSICNIPIFRKNNGYNVKTATSIFNKLNNRGPHSYLLLINTNNDKYYCNRGVIFNKYKELLMCCTVQIHFEEDDYKVDKLICRINPKIFSYKDILSKSIKNSVLPYFSTKELYFASNDFWEDDPRKVTVIIEDPSHLFKNPSAPTPTTFFNKDLNELILNNLNSINI